MDTRIAGPALRAGIYVRISEDRNGDELGVARQEQDGRELAERRGWTVAGIYSDDDRSAYSGKVRPDYRRLLADVASGQLQAVVAWDPDRLYRRPDDLAEFVNVVEAAGAPVATCKAGDIDLTSANGRLVARLLGDVSAHSSEHAAERIKRKMRELAETGKDHGGRRPFGWERNRRTLRAPVTFCRVADRAEITYSEPAMIRDATARVLAGGKGNGLKTIVTDWNRHGWPSTTGGMWTAASLRRVLRSVRISGRAEYRGRIVAERTDWVAIIAPGRRAGA